MAFRPNKYGPFIPCGEITVAVSGTAIQLSSNFNPAVDPNAPVTAAAPEQYAIAFDDLIINSPPTNAGGLYLVSFDNAGNTGGIGNVNTILLYIPKGSPPISVKKFLGNSKFNPNSLGIDADQNGDKCWAVGIV